MSKEVLKAASSKVFKQPYDGSHEMYFVVHDPVLTVVKAGPSAIQVLEVAEPYLGNPEDVAKGFNYNRLASAWREHRTWVAFDFMDRNVSKPEAYRMLAALVTELLDARCTGIYLPKEISSRSKAMDQQRSIFTNSADLQPFGPSSISLPM